MFWTQFYKTAEIYLCPNVEKHYFVFTDSDNIKTENNIHKIYQAPMGWPNDTLMRFHLFDSIKTELLNFDAVYFFNANYAFITPIQYNEIKPLAENNNLIGQHHPVAYHFRRKQFKYEANQISTAYIAPNEGVYYLAGGLIGGATKEFLDMCLVLKNNMDKDTENNVLAICHDESHINRYFVDFPPRILHPGYCYPQDWYLPFPKKTLLRD
ncbi:MAG: glycosyl transferase family 6, partial [Romboutsia sp.]|nr:glycosyl transferase family 6 [Romboutsia sp.]